jgi:hypothetical protein
MTDKEATQPFSIEDLDEARDQEKRDAEKSGGVKSVPADKSPADTSQAPDAAPDTTDGPPPSQEDPPAPGGRIAPREDGAGP